MLPSYTTISSLNPASNAAISSEHTGRKPASEAPLLNLNELIEPPEVSISAWPELPKEAKYGLAWEIAEAATRDTEADPAAVLITAITYAGAALGRRCYTQIGNSKHHPRIFSLVLGQTARARKGTSADLVLQIARTIEDSLKLDSKPVPNVTHGSISSGEGLVYLVRDESDEKDDNGKAKYPAVEDKRLFLIDSEISGYFQGTKREGNSASQTVRTAWDGQPMKPITKRDRLTATGHHIGICGHITFKEFKTAVPNSETHNGGLNRFLFFVARRPKLVSLPRPTPEAETAKLVLKMRSAIEFATEEQPEGEITMESEAEIRYDEIYKIINTEAGSEDQEALGARDDAYVRRLALLFALLDMSPKIRVAHIEAAWGVVRFSRASIAYICDVVPQVNPLGDSILKALEEAPGKRLAKTKLINIVGKHHRPNINNELKRLNGNGKITIETEHTSGAPRQIFKLA